VAVAAAVSESRTGRELWWALALGAAAVLICESLLSRWYTRRNEG